MKIRVGAEWAGLDGLGLFRRKGRECSSFARLDSVLLSVEASTELRPAHLGR